MKVKFNINEKARIINESLLVGVDLAKDANEGYYKAPNGYEVKSIKELSRCHINRLCPAWRAPRSMKTTPILTFLLQVRGRDGSPSPFSQSEKGEGRGGGRNLIFRLIREEMQTMVVSKLIVFLMAVSFFVATGYADERVEVGASFGEEGLRSFYFAIGEYFQVPQQEVVVIRERHIPEYEIPVVYYVAQQARVAPAAIIDLRLAGRSWMDITLHFGLSPEIYYVPVAYVSGPPYGKAYGHYKHKSKKEWKKIVLHDDDVINLVNLKVISEHYSYSPEDVIKLRSAGKDFIVINSEIRHKIKIKKGDDSWKEDDRERGKGRSKEKKKHRGKKHDDD